MIPVKSSEQIEVLAAAGRVLDTIIEDVMLREVRAGCTTREVADAVHNMILARKGEPVLRGYTQPGLQTPFPASCCVCVNEEVVHACPSSRIIREGDLVTVDVAMRYRGMCIDTAWSLAVAGKQRAVQARALALQAAAIDVLTLTTRLATPGTRWSSIARQCQQLVAARGMHLVHGYCGHGVGEQLHEAPRLSFTSPNWARPGEDCTLWPGMVLCIEPIVCEGTAAAKLTTLDDGWTVLTSDRRWTAHEERCLVITRQGARVLAGSSQYD